MLGFISWVVMTNTEIYSTRAWRELPRDGECIAEFLFGDAVGSCLGLIHRHHVDPLDPYSRSYQACARHHPKIQAALRYLSAEPRFRHCPHQHRSRESREQCEARLNHV